MTEQDFAALSSILERMPSGREAAWDIGMARLYKIALRNLPDGIASALVEAILDRTEPWRPAPGEIKHIVIELFAPRVPSPDEALEEVRYFIRRYGHNAKRIEGTNAFVLGDPSFSSTVIAAAVRSFGGWDRVCDNDDPSGVFEAHFKSAYVDRAEIDRARCLEVMREPDGFKALMTARKDGDTKRLAATCGNTDTMRTAIRTFAPVQVGAPGTKRDVSRLTTFAK